MRLRKIDCTNRTYQRHYKKKKKNHFYDPLSHYSRPGVNDNRSILVWGKVREKGKRLCPQIPSTFSQSFDTTRLIDHLPPILWPRQHVQSSQADTLSRILFWTAKLRDSAPGCTSL